MKEIFRILIFLLLLSNLSCQKVLWDDKGCKIGAFIADRPTKTEIISFQENYGKKPAVILVFIDWERFLDDKVLRDVYEQGSMLLITWEPWDAIEKKGISFEALLSGKFDSYLQEFARRLSSVPGDVWMRFAHEMNGNWYPWSGKEVSPEKYQLAYQYIKDFFDKEGTTNIKWVFSINWENVPTENNYGKYYPGDNYVDFIGLDGYNWGDSQSWSHWMSFKDLFCQRYLEVVKKYKKPVIISEFSSSGSGGNKALWIQEALGQIKEMDQVEAFVLFNENKETDWAFDKNSEEGKELLRALRDDYFR